MSVSREDAWHACSARPLIDSNNETAMVSAERALPLVRENDLKDADAKERKREDKNLQRLCNEILKLRHQIDARDATQNVVIYVALAIVCILLVVVLQNTWKLQHATECMLWYVRR